MNDVWRFFSRPENLNKLTDQEMKFKIITDVSGVEMYPGMFVEYKVSPFPGTSMRWVTEITEIRQGKYFIDEQRIGPYKIWHHEHHFEETDKGVVMRDLLYYAIPYGFLGSIANNLIVSGKVDKIFKYRGEQIKKIFPAKKTVEA